MLVLMQKSADPAICHVKLQQGRQRRKDTQGRNRWDRIEAQSPAIAKLRRLPEIFSQARDLFQGWQLVSVGTPVRVNYLKYWIFIKSFTDIQGPQTMNPSGGTIN